MNSLTSLELAALRQHQLRTDAARARLATRARRARHQRPRLDWLQRIASRWPRRSRTLSAKPAAVMAMARPRSFGATGDVAVNTCTCDRLAAS